MRKPTIYLAGPIKDMTDEECNGWRNFLVKELSHKYNFENPMDRDGRDGNIETVDIVEGDKKAIFDSDILVVNTSFTNSHYFGTSMEIIFAWMHHKKIYIVRGEGDVSPWVEYHASYVFKNFETLISFLRESAKPYADGR